MKIDKTVLKRAIIIDGEDFQIEMIIEECAELIHALQKLKRSGYQPDKIKQVIDELADVRIMVQQGINIFGKIGVQNRINFKINRLDERLKSKI